MGNFSDLPNNIPLSREGNFSMLSSHELVYSTRSLRSVSFTLTILLLLMIAVALFSTIIIIRNGELTGSDRSQSLVQITCLWLFPIVIFCYFRWLYHVRSTYKVTITEMGIIYQKTSRSTFYSHSEIISALETKAVLRDRIGVWLPASGRTRILLSESDTLPGRPFIEELMAFYGVQMPRDPYGTDRNTFSVLGLTFMFLVGPFFFWMGVVNENPNALTYSLYMVGFVFILGILCMFLSAHTTKSYKNQPKIYDFDEDIFIVDEDFPEDQEIAGPNSSKNTSFQEDPRHIK